MNDYNFRGITQSAHNPSTQAGFELRYNQSSSLQYYAGISGESIDFPNNAAAEIDFYGGFRPTFDKLALDFGFWYYWYPGGNCYGLNNVADLLPRTHHRSPVRRQRGWHRCAEQEYPTLAFLHRQRREGQRELLRVLCQGDLHN